MVADDPVLPHRAGILTSCDSSTGSPSLASSSFAFPPAPPSESTASTRSLPLTIPSLWVQLILTRFILYLEENLGRMPSGGEHSDGYLLESEDNSFSLDVQGNCTNCQFKVAALEISCCHGNPGSRDANGFHGNQHSRLDNTLFEKIMSSRHSVMTDQALRAIEHSPRDMFGPSIRTVCQNPVSPLGSFVSMEIASDIASHHPLEVKLTVQTFECVLWLPLVRCVMEMVSALIPTQRQTSSGEPGLGTKVRLRGVGLVMAVTSRVNLYASNDGLKSPEFGFFRLT